VLAEFVPPSLLAAMGWSPELFAGPAALALRAGQAGSSLEQMGARVLDGWRVSETPGSLAYDPRAAVTPVYRQANIGKFQLLLGEQHWASPQISGPWCVQPEDVVINKMAPVRAALVATNAKRHPVDGNSIIVRGLPRAAVPWVAACLNHPSYEQLLLLESGVLKRVGLGSINELRVPPTPLAMEGVASGLREILDEITITGENLHRVKAEAVEEASATQHPTPELRSGCFFPSIAVRIDNLLPSWVALRAEQAVLESQEGWVALDELASFDDRKRLTWTGGPCRALRLRDVSDDLLVPSSDQQHSSELDASRTLAKALVPGEVLVSTLGSSFRAAYVDDEVPGHTHPVDSWVRLRFRETPAAWALLLSTQPVRSQASRLTVGSVQQFVPPDAMRSLRLPAPPREVRERWQRAVDRHHAQRRSQERRWSSLRSDLMALFDAVHRPFQSRLPLMAEVVP
jgi:hypothetical protein